MALAAWAALLALALPGSASAQVAALQPRLSEEQAVARFLAEGKVADWVSRYPRKGRVTQAEYDRRYRDWTVRVWWGSAGEIALGRVDDRSGRVTEAWTGPQVAWTMARGIKGAFGGRTVNSLPVWLALSAVFLLGLADLRRPLSLRNLDLVALLSFSVSLWFFNQGRIFASVPLVYPPLLYLLARCLYVGVSGSPARFAARPAWALALVTVFLVGFRLGIVAESSNVIDVGYSGVIGAHRITTGQAPYGHFPREQGRPCAPPDRDGRSVFRVQANGRCEAANEHGDTYGPVAYVAYLPGYAILGWKGKGDDLDAARFTSSLFDVLCLLGLVLVGRRYGGRQGAATLAFAWAAYPFTLYALGSSTNDALPPFFLLLGFWLASSPSARGALVALASWTKFAPLVVAPLWLSYPEGKRGPAGRFAAAFLGATVAVFSILLLEPDPLQAVRVFWERTIPAQVGRHSPFSIWDWGRLQAGLPDLRSLQVVLWFLVAAGAFLLAWRPRVKTELQLAAFTVALLVAFQVVLTHWFYPYLPWVFPFLALTLLAPPTGSDRRGQVS